MAAARRPDDRISALRYDLQWLPRADRARREQRVAADRRRLCAWRRQDGVSAPAPGSISIASRCARRPTRFSATARKYQTAVLSFGQAGAPVWPAVLPAFPAGVLVSIRRSTRTCQDAVQRAGRRCRSSARSANVAAAQAGYRTCAATASCMSRNVNVPTLTRRRRRRSASRISDGRIPAFGNISQYDCARRRLVQRPDPLAGDAPAAWGGARVSYTLSKAQDDAGNAFFPDAARRRTTSSRTKGRRTTISATALVVSGSVRRWPAAGVATLDRALHGSSSARSGRMPRARRSRLSPARTTTTTRT